MTMHHQVVLTIISGVLMASFFISACRNVPEVSQKGFNNSALHCGEDWDTWKAPAGIQSVFMYYRSGHDKGGLTVYVMESWKANYYRDVTLGSQEYLKDFWKFYDQFYQRVEFDAARNNNQGIVLLLDWDGFSMNNYASAGALQMTLKMFTSLVRMNNAVRYRFNINVNFVAETFINRVEPFLGNMLDKFEMYGTRSAI